MTRENLSTKHLERSSTPIYWQSTDFNIPYVQTHEYVFEGFGKSFKKSGRLVLRCGEMLFTSKPEEIPPPSSVHPFVHLSTFGNEHK